MTIARAMAIRCCWPPLKESMERFSKPSRFTNFNAYLILSLMYSLLFLLIFNPNAIFSAMDICGNKAYFWKTVFRFLLFGGRLVMSTPSKMTCPLSGVSKPPKIRSVVVFPHPDGPRSVINSFSRIYKFNSSSTRLFP